MEEQAKYETEKQSIDTSLSTRGGLVPNNLEQMWRLAVIMSKSGLMPKGLQSPEAVCVAVQMGLEVGLTPMQAVQNIAVINGRPAIWGDSGIALVEASGFLEDFKETITVEGDIITATCWAKRRNRPTPVERTFTTQDAKQAGLHKKEGPWQQYPKRMTQMRARWWVLRDLFADVLKGLKAAEEVQDIIDVTPEPARTLKVNGGEMPEGPIYDIKGEPETKPQPPPENAATTAPGSGGPEVKPPKAKAVKASATRPIQEMKEEKPLFETEEKKDHPLDEFLATVEQYRIEIDDPKAWDMVLRVGGVTHAGVSSIPEGEPRRNFLNRCVRTLDQRNAARSNKGS